MGRNKRTGHTAALFLAVSTTGQETYMATDLQTSGTAICGSRCGQSGWKLLGSSIAIVTESDLAVRGRELRAIWAALAGTPLLSCLCDPGVLAIGSGWGWSVCAEETLELATT